MLTPALVQWLDRRREDASTSLGNQIRIELAERRRENAAK